MKKNSNLRYLFITRTLRGGGAERFITTFASYMADNGYDVHVITYEKTEDDYEMSRNIKIHMMPTKQGNFYSKIFRIVDMNKLIKKIAPNIVIPFIDTVVVCTWFASIFMNVKLIYTVRVSPWHEGGSFFSKFMRKIIARTADAIMLQTQEQSEYFTKVFSNKIYTVPNPISEKFINNCKKEYRNNIEKIVMIGRLEKQKNIKIALYAIKQLSMNKKVKLEVYGEGILKDELEHTICEMGLSECCQLMGRTNKVESVLENADLYIMTSDYEGMPNSLMEAMAMGVPIISSDCKTGPRDLIEDGVTGYLFKTADVNSLLEKLTIAIGDPERTNRIGVAGRKFILNQYRIENSLYTFQQMISGINKT